MVVLRLEEGLRGLDQRHDRRLPVRLLLRLAARGGLALILVVEEDHRAVLVADVPTLAVELRRIVLAPEHVEQLLVRDLVRVVRHLYDLGVTGRVRADVLVRRVLERAAGVPHARLRDAVDLTERGLDAPEAACAERRLLLHYSSSSLSAAELMQ